MLVDIQSQLPNIVIGADDVPVWKSRRGVYSFSETWNALRTKAPKFPWWQVLWFPLAIPRHAFMFGLCSGMLLLPKTGCVAGDLLEIPYVCFVMFARNLLITCSSIVVYVEGFGKL